MASRVEGLRTLLRAAELLAAGDARGARETLRARASATVVDAASAYALGVLRFLLGEHHEGLTLLERAAEDPRLRAAALREAQRRAALVGWDAEALRYLAARQALEPNSVALRVEEIRIRRRCHDAPGVVAASRELLALRPDATAWRLELANALLDVGDLEALREELAEVARAPEAGEIEAMVLERIRLHVEADEVEVASELADALAERSPRSLAAHVLRARFAAWRGDHARAVAIAERALALDPACGDAWCVLGGSRMLSSMPALAEEAIDRALALGSTHAEAALWKAELLLARDVYEGVAALLAQAAENAEGHSPVAVHLTRVEYALRNVPAYHRVTPYEIEECRAALDELVPDDERATDEGLSSEEMVELVRAARLALRGNRTVQATMLRDGRLHRLSLATRTGPRHASRRIVESLRDGRFDVALDRLARLEREYPVSPMPPCHRGEVALWAGNLEEAEADFQRAILKRRQTRYAYIGLTGVAMLRGDYDEALAIAEEGVRVLIATEGPALFVYRGECLRKLGRFEEAERDLERAVSATPSRLSAWMNLALVRYARGDSDAARRLFADVESRAPALLSDARRELREQGRTEDDPSVFEQALVMLGGNRASSIIVYRTAGRVRICPNSPGSYERVHRDDVASANAIVRFLRARLGGTPRERDEHDP